MNNYKYKEQLFLHLDGITVIPVILAIKKIGVLNFLEKKESFTLSEIEDEFKINKGYFSIALRTLLSVGLLKIEEENISTTTYIINHKQLNLFVKAIDCDNEILELMNIYIDLKGTIVNTNPLTKNNLELLKNILIILENKKKLFLDNQNSKNEEDIYYFIEGIIIGPLLSYIGYYNLSKEDIRNDDLRLYI